MAIRVVTDGKPFHSRAATKTYEHTFNQFARARLSMDDGRGDVFELYLDDAGNLELRQLPRVHEAGEARVIYSRTAAERAAGGTGK